MLVTSMCMLWVRVRNAWLRSSRACELLVGIIEGMNDEGQLTLDNDKDHMRSNAILNSGSRFEWQSNWV